MVIQGLITGGAGLSLGSNIIDKLPASAAQSGVQGGLASAGSFFPVMGTLGGASLTLKQLKKLKEVK